MKSIGSLMPSKQLISRAGDGGLFVKNKFLHDDADLAEFVALQQTFADSAKSWSVDVTGIDLKTFDLSVKNPAGGEELSRRTPQDIMDETAELDAESTEVLGYCKK